MEGGVRVTKQNNIFNLIRNSDATVDDLRKLIEIAPRKLQEKENRLNPLDLALSLNKETMAKLLQDNGLVKTDFTIEDLYRGLLINPPLEDLKNIIKDKDLSIFTDKQQENILNRIINSDNWILKITELIKSKFNPNILYFATPLLSYVILKNHTEFAKFLLNNGADPNKEIIRPDYYGGVNAPLGVAIIYKNLEILKYLIEKGADINYLNNNKSYYFLIYKHKLGLEYYKVFLDAGLNPDIPINREQNISLLMTAILKDNKPLFDLLIDKGANVNYIGMNNNTPLIVSMLTDTNIYYIKKLIEKGADINAKSTENGTVLIYAVNLANSERSIKIIEYLLEHGVDKTVKTTTNKTAADIARDKLHTHPQIYKKILEILGEPVIEEKWKGSSRSDIEKYDMLFEKPYDWSCCPICLEYVERSDGCMYMSHDCAKTKHFYHKKLYNAYVYNRFEEAPNKIEWCTICGRPTKEHKHYILSSANAPSKEFAPLNPKIQEQLNRGDNQAFFDNANCMGFGGGGIEEKAARFRRLREYTLELQEDVNKKSFEDAMSELIEEVFNAPLIRNRKIKKILEDKLWNINVKEFPENTRKNKNNANTNANANAQNIPFNGRLPTVVNEGEPCIVGFEEPGNEDNKLYHFHHETVGGLDHNGIYICKDDLAQAIEIANKEFGTERFGKCWYSQCQGTLHPEEIKGIIPEVLYQDYRKKFNKKMKQGGGRKKTRKVKTQHGGNYQTILHKLDLSNAVCSPPNYTKNGKNL